MIKTPRLKLKTPRLRIKLKKKLKIKLKIRKKPKKRTKKILIKWTKLLKMIRKTPNNFKMPKKHLKKQKL